MVADIGRRPFSKSLEPPLIIAEKIQNSAEKIQQITNPVKWILSKQVCEAIDMFIGSNKTQLL